MTLTWARNILATLILVTVHAGIPLPQRRMTVYQPSYLSDGQQAHLGQRGKDQGHGGFPGPIQLSQKVAQRFLPRLYGGLKELLAAHRRSDKKRFERLQEQFNNLIIGRNSDFNTEELTDEELEELGGLECVFIMSPWHDALLMVFSYRYKALNLLSYLVAFVSPHTAIVIGFRLIPLRLSTSLVHS